MARGDAVKYGFFYRYAERIALKLFKISYDIVQRDIQATELVEKWERGKRRGAVF